MSDYQYNPNVEQWKEIPDFPGYEVSDQGRVRSYHCAPGYGGGMKLCDIPKKILRHDIDQDGYHRVYPYRNGKREKRGIHVLVLLTFIGPCPPGMEACHNDGNPGYNYLHNLRWDTQQSNTNDRDMHGKTARGNRHWFAKLSIMDIIEIRRLRFQGYPRSKIALLFGCSSSHVGNIACRRTWKHIP